MASTVAGVRAIASDLPAVDRIRSTAVEEVAMRGTQRRPVTACRASRVALAVVVAEAVGTVDRMP